MGLDPETRAAVDAMIASTPKEEIPGILAENTSCRYEENEDGTFRRLSPGEKGSRKRTPVKFTEVDKWLNEAKARKERFDAWHRERTLTTEDEIRLIHLFRQLDKKDQLQLQIDAFKLWEGKARAED